MRDEINGEGDFAGAGERRQMHLDKVSVNVMQSTLRRIKYHVYRYIIDLSFCMAVVAL